VYFTTKNKLIAQIKSNAPKTIKTANSNAPLVNTFNSIKEQSFDCTVQ